jgi:phosphoenolpyruvate-protein kinase (PTS system EI component)
MARTALESAPQTQLSATVSSTGELERLLAGKYRQVGLVRCELIPDDELAEFLQLLLGQVPDAWILLPDLGGDKASTEDPNPALGLRGVRRYHAYPEELSDFLTVLSATPQSAAPLHLLTPMLTNRTQVGAVEDAIHAQLGDRPVKLGAMIETPAAALQAEEFANICQFLCLGTTDLAQYVYAADRLTPALSAYAHPAAPPLMELYGRTIQAAKQKKIPVGICGMAAADPTVGPFLLATGASHLSVPVDDLDGLAQRLAAC